LERSGKYREPRQQILLSSDSEGEDEDEPWIVVTEAETHHQTSPSSDSEEEEEQKREQEEEPWSEVGDTEGSANHNSESKWTSLQIVAARLRDYLTRTKWSLDE
jgi:hypothetical protein